MVGLLIFLFFFYFELLKDVVPVERYRRLSELDSGDYEVDSSISTWYCALSFFKKLLIYPFDCVDIPAVVSILGLCKI